MTETVTPLAHSYMLFTLVYIYKNIEYIRRVIPIDLKLLKTHNIYFRKYYTEDKYVI